MAGIATTTGADMDPTPIPSISVDPVDPAIMAIMVVLAIMVGQVVLAVTADPLALPDRCGLLTELI